MLFALPSAVLGFCAIAEIGEKDLGGILCLSQRLLFPSRRPAPSGRLSQGSDQFFYVGSWGGAQRRT